MIPLYTISNTWDQWYWPLQQEGHTLAELIWHQVEKLWNCSSCGGGPGGGGCGNTAWSHVGDSDADTLHGMIGFSQNLQLMPNYRE
jgi:hypothetical protein